ncbi:MAG: ribonucleoside-diphosphate reductase [Verrucomicrobiales bacterium]|nr:ribonucleoside-diphosphate reductase [Verrucomicrobiales bacterium]|tara:strand:+ start:9704 stop:10759 length:1056 start_codon:yes stop_codon:yes gene_type:complete
MEKISTSPSSLTRKQAHLLNKKLQEPILTPNKKRYSLFPIQDQEIWAKYKQAESCFWTAEEIELSKDIGDWNELDESTKHWLELVLAFFSQADEIVGENLVQNFSQEIQLPEARSWFGMQIAIENIHAETYSLLIDTYVKDDKKKQKLFDAIDNYESVKQKAHWCFKWMEPKKQNFATRLVAFAAVEMLFFSSSFAAIFYVKKQGKLPGLTFSNELISRDEAMHCEFACLLYSKLVNKIKTETIHKIIKEAVDIEVMFVKEAIPESTQLINISSTKMEQYVKYVADYLCTMLHVQKIYNVENPLDFMKLQAFTSFGKVNFFEKRNSNYSLPGVNNLDQGKLDGIFDMESDF